MEKVALEEAFASFDERWAPRVAAEVNDQSVKLVKVDGEFVWHHHDDADELFFVTDGALRIELREESDVHLTAGEFAVVPRGVEHRPVADEPAEILLVEPADTLNTGNVEDERTRRDLDCID